MPSTTINGEDLKVRVSQAFQGQSARLRTVGGVARDTGLTVDVVEEVLKRNPDVFKPSPMSPPGSPVYRIADSEPEN